ncbi:hypothetical protein QE152_g8813 [Popillia japonica]|uniref:Uncharacterized protein n=1 Tax=Popillia japonica TaxID=7064 RepID=A0AAW1LWQ2_POPJA
MSGIKEEETAERGPDADTNYFLVGIKMKQEIPDERNKRRRNGRTKQISSGREENREVYRNELRENCQDLQIGSDIEESWAVLRDKILESAF